MSATFQDSLNQLYAIQNEINLSQLGVSSEHASLLDDKSVSLSFRQDATQGTMTSIMFSLTEALLQIQSSIFTVSNMNLTEFVAEDQGGGGPGSEEVFFILYNSFNDLLVAMRKSKSSAH